MKLAFVKFLTKKKYLLSLQPIIVTGDLGTTARPEKKLHEKSIFSQQKYKKSIDFQEQVCYNDTRIKKGVTKMTIREKISFAIANRQARKIAKKAIDRKAIVNLWKQAMKQDDMNGAYIANKRLQIYDK